jgi:hypothetical protein
VGEDPAPGLEAWTNSRTSSAKTTSTMLNLLVVMLYPRLTRERHNSLRKPPLAKTTTWVSLEARLRCLLPLATLCGPSAGLNVSDLNRSKHLTQVYGGVPAIG